MLDEEQTANKQVGMAMFAVVFFLWAGVHVTTEANGQRAAFVHRRMHNRIGQAAVEADSISSLLNSAAIALADHLADSAKIRSSFEERIQEHSAQIKKFTDELNSFYHNKELTSEEFTSYGDSLKEATKINQGPIRQLESFGVTWKIYALEGK